jgi:D-serine deaminase-like pyridoxal phosphate-dependent protein
MQLDLGAIGITTAKLSEAEVLAEHGVRDLFVCYPIVGAAKLDRLRRLAHETNLMTLVESEEGARGLSEAMRGEDRPLDVVLDIDVGFHRVGVPPDDAPRLAGVIASLPGLRLRGVSTHEGSVYGVTTPEERAALAREQVGRLVDTAQALRREGQAIDIVSCGSTPGATGALQVDGITEMRPGNYVFYDAMQAALGTVPLDRCALSVVATVVSSHPPDRAVADAGSKALTTDRGAHGGDTTASFGVVRGRPGITVERLSEEHGWLRLDDGESVRISDRLDIIPNHACVVCNLFDEVAVTRGDEVVGVWKVAGRGRVV